MQTFMPPIREQSWPTGTMPVVSVMCFAYNHERFIAQCLDRDCFLLVSVLPHASLLPSRIIKSHGIATGILGLIHRHVGMFEQGIHRFFTAMKQAAPDAG